MKKKNRSRTNILKRYYNTFIICISIFLERMLNYNQKEEQENILKKKEMSIMLKKLEAFLAEYYESFHLG